MKAHRTSRPTAKKTTPSAKRLAGRKPARPKKSKVPARRAPAAVLATAAPHVARALEYAKGVVAGKIVAGRWTRLACERYLRDLTRQRDAAFAWRFDERAAERFCRFAERLPHIKGPKAGQPFRLEDWQCFFAANVYGWLSKATGMRRFRRVYLEVARGNGKSFFLALMALYALAADDESGAEIYSAATTRDQAKIVFKVAQQIVRKSPELRAALGIEVLAHSIVQTDTASAFIPLSAEENSLDGLNTHFAAIDELHAHKTRGVYDVIETSLGKRAQPLLALITTAGSDRTGICYEVRGDLCNVLEGTFVDENFFGVVYTIDEGQDWRDEAIWPAANPNLGVSVSLDHMRSIAKKAERTPAAQNAFKTKHLDVWVGANAALYSLEDWQACADPNLRESDFAGEPCIAAIDLATKNDLLPYAKVFERPGDDGRPHYYAFVQSFLPQEALDDGRNAQYQGWATEGWLTVAGASSTDQDAIRDAILADSQRFQLDEVCFDPWQAQNLATQLMKQGATMVELRQTVATFSEPTKALGALMKERRIHHDGNPVLAWAIGNVVGHYDAKENVYPRKERRDAKIDPAIAVIMSLSRWLRREVDTESEYERRAREAEGNAPREPGAAAPDPDPKPTQPAGRRSIYDSPEWQETHR